MKIPVAIILDEMTIQPWQQCSLDIASDLIDIKLILNCQNTKNKKNYLNNFFYYVLNIFSMKFDMNRRISFPNNNISVYDFKSEYAGVWQTVPNDVVTRLKKDKIKLVIKFGMNLLRISEELEEFDIMSFHHGDPKEFRGRPAGFYEIHLGSKKIGAIVQLLSNNLDGGKIAAKGFSSIYLYSYKKTLINLYKNSSYLLKAAITNYKNDNIYAQSSTGKNYRLPNNLVVLDFLLKIFFRKLERIFKAAFFEKKWNIALYDSKINFLNKSNLSLKDSLIPQIPKKYDFYADPFFSPDKSSIRVEALNKLTRKGEIIELDIEHLNFKKEILSGHHFSYPFSICYKNDEYLFPEVAENQSASYYHLNSFNELKPIQIKGMEEIHITDPTLCKVEGYYYIFCNHLDAPNERLHLYLSDNFFGPYTEHPLSPITLDPESARMAGCIIQHESNLYRFGQNNCFEYGKEITVHKIAALSPNEYEEEKMNTLRYIDSFGPHTINFQGNKTVTDFYSESFSLIAGFKRVLGLIIFKLTK